MLEKTEVDPTPKECIFISYRREGGSSFASILHFELCKAFIKQYIFKDIYTLVPGSDFKKEIDSVLEKSLVILVLIDKNWVNLMNPNGEIKLFSEHDFVSHEIKVAIENNLEIIPVLFENGVMPTANELPDFLQPLCDKQSFTIHPESVMEDVLKLIEVIKAKKKYLFNSNTVMGAYERIIKDPVNTLKTSWNFGSEIYIKDFNTLKSLIKKFKK